MNELLTFGTWLKDRRNELDLTQFDLAERIGCSGDTIQKIEAGNRRPSRQVAEILADYFTIPDGERQEFLLFARGHADAWQGKDEQTPQVKSAWEERTGVAPTPRSLSHSNNLPLQFTSFIGRDMELPRIRDLIRNSEVRLLTLTGPGGTGKTRLALQIAAGLPEEFSNGIWFVQLAPITDHNLVISTIAQTLDVTETAGSTLIDTLKALLKEKEMLLLLDNFEQVVEAADQVGHLLAACPHLKVLATSRVPLRIRGEKEYAVSPLLIPDVNHLPSLEKLVQFDAVRLFIERATDVKADFQVNSDNAPSVAEICARLDGLPLAVELAAARIRVLPPHALLSRLSSRLKVLTGGARDLPARQQTLRNTIEWSYDLLDEGHRQLFRRMSVLKGGCILETVERVCNYDEALQVDVFEGVEALLTSNLIQLKEGSDGEPRFWLLETIHEYAREKLAESGEAEPLQREQALYIMRLAEEAEPHLAGEKQQEWLDRLEDEHDNIRAALEWAGEQGKAEGAGKEGEAGEAREVGLRISGVIWFFWSMRSLFAEGRMHLERAISTAGASGASGAAPLTDSMSAAGIASKIKALIGAGKLAYRQGEYSSARSLTESALVLARDAGDKQSITGAVHHLGNIALELGDYARAPALYEESLAVAREVGDKSGIAHSLNSLGNVAFDRGDHAGARALFEESLQLSRELGDKSRIADTLENLGHLAYEQGDHTGARALYEESLAIYKELGIKWAFATTLSWLGNLAVEEGDYAEARALFEESLARCKELGDKTMVAYSLKSIGAVALEEGDYAEARALFEESLAIATAIGDRKGIVACLAGLGSVAARVGQLERGAMLIGAVEGLLEGMGVVMWREDRVPYERYEQRVRDQLGEEEFERARQEGRSMSMEEAVDYALR